MNKIAVVIPVYKVEEYLDKCVKSVLNQTYKNFEIILVDDGSPDNCPQMCDDMARKYENITALHKENGGLADARNAGIEYALSKNEFKWITFIDSDDWVSEKYLEVLLNTAERFGANISIAKFIFLKADEKEEKDNKSVPEDIELDPEQAYIRSDVNTVSACAKLYEINLFENVRYAYGKLHEDRHTTYKILFACKTVAVSFEEIYYYRYNGESISNSNWKLKYSTDNIEAVEAQLEYFDKNSYELAWKSAATAYADLLVTTLNILKAQNGEYKSEYSLYKKTLKKFVIKNAKRAGFKLTKTTFVLTYPLFNRIINRKHNPEIR